jgi:hypothetical protein
MCKLLIEEHVHKDRTGTMEKYLAAKMLMMVEEARKQD